MAALNAIAREYADEIRDGIAWVIVWKTGRSWHAESVYLNPDDDTFKPEDLGMVRKALEQDPNAVMLNGYYCGHLAEDMSAAEIAGGIRWHYENGYNLLKDSAAFPPEPMERPADLPADMPWYGKATSAGPDPYVYDGYMSTEDYELMHEYIKADTSAVQMKHDVSSNTQISDIVTLANALEAFGKAAAVGSEVINHCMDNLLYNANDHPKWWHLYKHARKYRTRKKYRRRLLQQLISRLEAAAAA